MTYKNACESLERGEIWGFSVGYYVTAKKDSFGVGEKRLRLIDKGNVILARKFSKTSFEAEIAGEPFSFSRKDFIFPPEPVVLDTWGNPEGEK